MAQWMYVKHADLKPVVDWLKTKPEGELKILISGTVAPTATLLQALRKEGQSFEEWFVSKLQSGQLEINGSKTELMDLPIGILLEY